MVQEPAEAGELFRAEPAGATVGVGRCPSRAPQFGRTQIRPLGDVYGRHAALRHEVARARLRYTGPTSLATSSVIGPRLSRPSIASPRRLPRVLRTKSGFSW